MINIKIGNWAIYFYNPFKKDGSIERIIGIQGYKDWHHSFEYDMRFSLFEIPHVTFYAAYTNEKKQEYVTKFYTIASKSYRRKNGGLKWYWKQIYRQGIDEVRGTVGW